MAIWKGIRKFLARPSDGALVYPRAEDGHGSAPGTPSHVSVVASALPTGAATAARQDTANTLLSQVKALLETQREIANTLWTDDSGAVYVRREVIDETTGVVTVSFVDANGGAASPGAGLRPMAGVDKEVTQDVFSATEGGTGYSDGDTLSHVTVIDSSTTPVGVTSVWLNLSTGLIISTPTPGTYQALAYGVTNALGVQVNPATEGELTARLLRRHPADGYRIWFDLEDAAYLYIMEAPAGTASGATGFRGVRVPAAPFTGQAQVNTDAGLTFDARKTDGNWS